MSAQRGRCVHRHVLQQAAAATRPGSGAHERHLADRCRRQQRCHATPAAPCRRRAALTVEQAGADGGAILDGIAQFLHILWVGALALQEAAATSVRMQQQWAAGLRQEPPNVAGPGHLRMPPSGDFGWGPQASAAARSSGGSRPPAGPAQQGSVRHNSLGSRLGRGFCRDAHQLCPSTSSMPYPVICTNLQAGIRTPGVNSAAAHATTAGGGGAAVQTRRRQAWPSLTPRWHRSAGSRAAWHPPPRLQQGAGGRVWGIGGRHRGCSGSRRCSGGAAAGLPASWRVCSAAMD